ncbi:hypothetical protein OG596_25680 [Streptomyces sp. NBC_01102]|uniref:hypothetical protein n=1 Tax=Streptomyces sp. NBC_01102 TaxID=2903749 RepID=UPI0038670F93|nr:hypothetical protein OG596_25680 [Streptomyces sp. NBC_01102]
MPQLPDAAPTATPWGHPHADTHRGITGHRADRGPEPRTDPDAERDAAFLARAVASRPRQPSPVPSAGFPTGDQSISAGACANCAAYSRA